MRTSTAHQHFILFRFTKVRAVLLAVPLKPFPVLSIRQYFIHLIGEIKLSSFTAPIYIKMLPCRWVMRQKIRVYVIKRNFTIESGIANLTVLRLGGHKCPLWPKLQFYCKKRSWNNSYEGRAYEWVGKKGLSLGYVPKNDEKKNLVQKGLKQHAVNYLSILYWSLWKIKCFINLIDKDLIILNY